MMLCFIVSFVVMDTRSICEVGLTDALCSTDGGLSCPAGLVNRVAADTNTDH